MSLPITAVGPLNVLTNPILMESAAIAGFASARTVAPASQNAVLISFSLLAFCVCRQSDELSASGFLIIGGVLCARSIGHAASAPLASLRAFGRILQRLCTIIRIS